MKQVLAAIVALGLLLLAPVLAQAGYSPILSTEELRDVLESGWPESDSELLLHLERNEGALDRPRSEGAILTLALRALSHREQPESVEDLLAALELAAKEADLERRLELQRALLMGWVSWLDGPHEPEDLLAATRQLSRQRVSHSELLLQATRDLASAKKRLAMVCQKPSQATSANEKLLNRMRSAQRKRIFERVSRLSASYVASIEAALKKGDSEQLDEIEQRLESARKPLRGFGVPDPDKLAWRLAAETFPDYRPQINSLRWTRALHSGALFLTRAASKAVVPRRPPVDPFGKTMRVRQAGGRLSVTSRGPESEPAKLQIGWPPKRPEPLVPETEPGPQPVETPAGSIDRDEEPSLEMTDPEEKK